MNTPTSNFSTDENETQSNKGIAPSVMKILEQFDLITLEEMDKVRLMNRVDTKYLLGIEKLEIILKKAMEHYRVVEINGLRSIPYSSIYFDTPDSDMYIKHHNGRLNRYKVRMRSYIDSGLTFLEVKRKSNKGRTSKKRIKLPNEHFQRVFLSDAEEEFIASIAPYNPKELVPSLQNFFHRITLVDKKETERVTLDIGLSFRKVGEKNYREVENLVVVELKQDGSANSYFRKYLTEMSVLPKGMSKYCLGMVLKNPDLKSNRFKKKLRLISKVTNKDITGNTTAN